MLPVLILLVALGLALLILKMASVLALIGIICILAVLIWLSTRRRKQ